MSVDTLIRFENLSKTYQLTPVLKDLNIGFEPRKTYVLIGESGCGKTTCLRLINGLIRPTKGQVLYRGVPHDYRSIVETRRQMGYALQGSTLFPHYNVLENISIVARQAGWDPKRISKRALEVMDLVQLSPDEFLKKKPRQISGGQQQRVSLARALFLEPDVLLMDEPFGALDPITRNEVQEEFIRLQERLQLTVIMVTHDLSEAFKMSDRILLLNEGVVEQEGRPNDLLLRPKTKYVEQFLHSRSAGQQLESVVLYSVMDPDPWVVIESQAGWRLSSGDQFYGEFSQWSDLQMVLKENGVSVVFRVDENRQFLGLAHINGEKPSWDKEVITLNERDHFLNGLKCLFRTRYTALPVINEAGVLKGSMSEGAIHAL